MTITDPPAGLGAPDRPARGTDGPATGSRPLVGDAAARVAALDGAQFDAVVLGAGILGAGVARELARRGRRTLVVERRDAGWGTTNRSTRLVHGGLRYLEHFDFPLVYEGLRERGWLLSAGSISTARAGDTDRCLGRDLRGASRSYSVRPMRSCVRWNHDSR